MVIIIRIILITSALLLCSSFSSTQVQTAPDYTAIEKQVRLAFEEITKVAESVDADKLFSYVLDNDKGCQIQNGKIVLTRQDALDSYKKNSPGIEAIKYNIDKFYVTVVSPETAIVVSEGNYEATTIDQRKFNAAFAQTAVFVCKDKQWKVLHAHTSSPDNRRQ